MKKLIYLLTVVVVVATACSKDLSDLNVDPKQPAISPSYAFFTNAQRTLTNTLTSSNVNLNIFRLIVQHWQETQYPEESQYDLGGREINDNVWDALYRDVIRDLREAKVLIPGDVKTSTGADDLGRQQNEIAIAEILEIYTWYYLVTTYGNIPYTEAFNIDDPFPAYDDAKTIYNDLLTRLDAAIGQLDNAEGSFETADIVYNGDVDQWSKFANSLKLRMGITIADDDDAKAKSVIESAVAAGVFESNADNAVFAYLGAPPNTNPIWVDLVQSGRDDFVAASTLINELLAKNDPRIDNFFTEDQDGRDDPLVSYSGADPGVQSAYVQYSQVKPTITAAAFPGLLLDYAEVEFYLAEAAQRGYTVGGTAADHYAAGVTASIEYWGGTAGEATTYLAQPSVAYNPANWKESIGIQQWISHYNRGYDAWNSWRRLDYPQLEEAADALSGIPVRYPYPVNEQLVNRPNFEAAAAAIGGDFVETKLWFDKF
ncbi:MAG: SusD/RagB family nutrient-binding outer membrane lipoprotein [Chitinophagaceae bacterium]|nr:MAG: SusD/RagB family nutrient-binding outer membrane lipoprotein [Chitinophagaceae bacterium]